MTGTSPPGIKMPTTIVFFEVSIPRRTGPAASVTPDMTAGSLPPLWLRFAGAGRFIVTNVAMAADTTGHGLRAAMIPRRSRSRYSRH